jgi:hypothetical protein
LKTETENEAENSKDTRNREIAYRRPIMALDFAVKDVIP